MSPVLEIAISNEIVCGSVNKYVVFKKTYRANTARNVAQLVITYYKNMLNAAQPLSHILFGCQ